MREVREGSKGVREVREMQREGGEGKGGEGKGGEGEGGCERDALRLYLCKKSM